ncbi:hypothetical protein Pan44_36250 [Caulifigura coniformis]|uniref:Uncharacterized protein n=1 Tax=Caulifigura coniformis TaxID=2527983 RepID=A0A517SHH6_9PLAN|nr:hypothetical protein [Caulifigura coniformis]QDT55580.1 hypothetical protein Pan44_36250 [Caulifigura coniformis]
MFETPTFQPDPIEPESARNAREIARVFRISSHRAAELLEVDHGHWKAILAGTRPARPGLASLMQSIVDTPLFKLRARLVDELEKTDRPIEQLCAGKTAARIYGVWEQRRPK